MSEPKTQITQILDGAHYYSDARFMISLSKLGSYAVILLGSGFAVMGLLGSSGAYITVPIFGSAGPFLFVPAVLLWWVAVSGLSAAQTKQANLDAAEAALLSLKIIKEDRPVK